MADREKRRSAGSPAAVVAEPGQGTKASGPGTDREFLSQAGIGELLRGAVLKMVEARPDDPIGFLADHFGSLAAAVVENGCDDQKEPCQVDGLSGEGAGGARAQQRLNRALWHLRLAHHSQRSAFGNNIRVAYDLLSATGPFQHAGDGSPTGASGGGVRGGLYTQTLRCLCGEGGVPASTSAPLLCRLHCHDHEAVPYGVFRHGVLTCAVFSDYIRLAQRLYAQVCRPDEGPASRAPCLAVLGALRQALETSHDADNPSVQALRRLEASAKMSPHQLACAMTDAQTRDPAGHMDAKEFENAAAELFIARVKVVS
ncbi:tubulin polyglutamylase complex subunit 1 [Corythoichthys intestinalis]|uniref:tubulin polyglutamylase complex subunit 1 n=1 Tax=Corythoichthys intestinalis TaxID=161448 RepID=UPI0025A51DA5|nr:tubulin polyglutamylase complex subunit 1 [Corythoichthys intestinalis]XP_061798513.1 tubulin polyglutamylase complex subunit 1-like [Nerophis lumbriciformis]